MLTKNIEETKEEIYMKKLTEVNAQFEDLWIQGDDTTKKSTDAGENRCDI